MSSFNKTTLPTLSKLALDILYNNVCTVFKSSMMHQQTAIKELVSFLIILKEVFVPMYIGNFMDQMEKQSLLSNGDNVMQLAKCYGINGFRPNTTKMDFDTMEAKSAFLAYAFCSYPFLKQGYKNRFEAKQSSKLVVGSGYETEQFRKPRDEDGYGVKPYASTGFLEDLIRETFPLINFKSSVLKYVFQFLLEIKGVMKNPLKHLMPANKKPKISNPNYRKLPNKKKALSNISEYVPKPNTEQDLTASDDVQTCQECRERLKMKKFFDERRFGIFEKCGCVICYGCLRNLVGGSNGIVKGPVKCPRCFVKSKNVASNARWIQGEEKVRFFKEYCKNLENTYIKIRLGWTSFPTRKDVLRTLVP